MPACCTRNQTLLELVDYVNSAKQPFVEAIMPEVVNMVSSHEHVLCLGLAHAFVSSCHHHANRLILFLLLFRCLPTFSGHYPHVPERLHLTLRRMSPFWKALGRICTLCMSFS
jgi:hypothetical protein